MLQKLSQYRFLFEELVKRDFKKKYKRTVLGMAWSVLSPLMMLLVMRLVFTQFFGRNMEHYTTYLFCGNLIFSYFNESSTQGMTSLMGNSAIFTKVNVPKYLFLFSKNVQTLINFGLTLCVFFIFCVLDGITFTWRFILLLYPIFCLVLFNLGVGLILSALFVFFRDISYLYDVFTMLLMYMSAIFYTVDGYPAAIQRLFLCNPVYCVIKYIRYFRKIVIDAAIPSVWFHLLMLADAAAVLEKNPNVCADLSGLLEGRADLDRYFVERAGYVGLLRTWMDYLGCWDRFLYGTDWPIVNLAEYRDYVTRIVPEERRPAVFFDNANRVYGLGL